VVVSGPFFVLCFVMMMISTKMRSYLGFDEASYGVGILVTGCW